MKYIRLRYEQYTALRKRVKKPDGGGGGGAPETRWRAREIKKLEVYQKNEIKKAQGAQI